MSTHSIPRNVKGEGRILMVFSVKALIYSAVGAGIGFLIHLLLGLFGVNNFVVTIVLVLIFGGIGFSIATFKVPETTAFKFTQIAGGENIDDVILRAIKFKANKNRIYVHDIEGETEDEQ